MASKSLVPPASKACAAFTASKLQLSPPRLLNPVWKLTQPAVATQESWQAATEAEETVEMRPTPEIQPLVEQVGGGGATSVSTAAILRVVVKVVRV